MSAEQRVLGAFEKYQVSLQLVKCYGAVAHTAVIHHAPRRSSSDVKEYYLGRLHPALARLVEKHPLLSVAVRDVDKPTVCYVTIPDFDLESIVTFGELAFWEADAQAHRLAEQCDKEFDLDDQSLPLWRLHIDTHPDRPEECSVTVAIHHGMADGKSLSIFWHELMQHLNSNISPFQCQGPYIIHSNRSPINPPFEERNGPTLGFVDGIKYKASKLFPSWFETPKNAWQGDRPAIMDKDRSRHDTGVRVIKLGGPAWPKICETAKEHGVTPHAAIMAAVLLAFVQVYPDEQVLETYTPIDCRPFCQPSIPGDEMGNFIGSYAKVWTLQSLKNKYDTSSFWELAKLYHANLRANKIEAAKEVRYLQLQSRYPEDFCEPWYEKWQTCRMGRSGGIEFSDLGRSNLMNVREVYFCQSAQTFTIGWGVNTISTKDCMYATLSFQKGALDETKLEAFGPAILAKLEASI